MSWACLLGAGALAGGCSLESALNADAMTESAEGGATEADATVGADASGSVVAACDGKLVRVMTFNVQTVDTVGSPSHDALAAVLGRTAPDIACLQEVQFDEDDSLAALVTEAGYAYSVQANQSPAIGGDHTNACIANVPLTVVGSYTGEDLSADPTANDVGRDIFAVRAFVGAADGTECNLGVIAVHLKSGQETIDLFRRQVEVIRLTQAVAAYRQAHPGDPIVVLGDFNETLDEPALGTSLALPPDLPSSYRLGSDIEVPVSYQPFATLQGAGFNLADPTQEDGPSSFATWNDSRRLDYVWYAGPQLAASEVYNSCRDDGVDEPPTGDGIVKVGTPLECGVSETASDHFPVVADLSLP